MYFRVYSPHSNSHTAWHAAIAFCAATIYIGLAKDGQPSPLSIVVVLALPSFRIRSRRRPSDPAHQHATIARCFEDSSPVLRVAATW